MHVRFYFALLMQMVLTSASFFPQNDLTIVEKQGFLVYFIPILDFSPLRSCKVTISGASYDFDPTTVTPGNHTLPSGTELVRFSQNLCGVRVKKLDRSDEGKWEFDVTDIRGRSDKGTLTVNVLVPKLEPSVQNITAVVDNSLKKIRCPNSDGARYCNIYNRYGEQFLNTCEQQTTLTIDQNQWTCQVFRWGNMHQYNGAVYVYMEDRRKDAINEIYETATHLVMSCTVTNSASQCRAEMPGKKQQLLLMNGLLTDHYSAYDTVISKGHCSVEIEKPLKPEDIGTWRILFDGVSNNNLGCVFQVGGSTAKTAEGEITRRPRSNQDNPKAIEVMGDVHTTTSITCEANYEISYCYLQPPTPDSKSSDYLPVNFQNTKYLGQCRFLVRNITSGQWVCGLNDENSGEDVLTYYQVTVYEEPGQVTIEKVKAGRGDSVQLMCKTVMNQPMNYCRFITPAGQIHGLSQNSRNIPGSRYSYYGKGLAEGECGIEIEDLQSSDFGNWFCTFQIDTKEYTLSMDLEAEALSLAAAWGLGLGLTIIVMLGTGFIGHRYFLRQSDSSNASVRNEYVMQRQQSMQSVSDASTQSHNS